MIKHHELKIDDLHIIQAIRMRDKRAEFRKDDREFAVGDTATLTYSETNENAQPPRFKSSWVRVVITHIQRGPKYGIPEGYCMFSFENITAGAEI